MKYKITLNSLLLSSSFISSGLTALTTVDLSTFTTSSPQGYAVYSPSAGDGFTAGSTRDFNGDGIADLVIGSSGADPLSRNAAGTVYVFYGQQGGYSSAINLGSLTSSQGCSIYGSTTNAILGAWVNGLDDVNGDGLSDITIGSVGSSTNLNTDYVIFGQVGGYTSPIDTASFSPGPSGFYMMGSINSGAGFSSSSAGDFNGDGIEDVLVGAPFATPSGRTQAGTVYIVYGQPGGYATPLNLDSMTPSQGFAVYGAAANDRLGYTVSSIKDFNNDGIDDIIVGAPFATSLVRTQAGTAYILYGQPGGYAAPIDLSVSLPVNQGFAVYGAGLNYKLGYAVNRAGDFNHDGIPDIILTTNAQTASSNAGTASIPGEVSIIFGTTGGYGTNIDMASPPAGSVLIIQAPVLSDGFGYSVVGLGDINNDGYDDIGVGAVFATVTSPTTRTRAGKAYVILGQQASYSSPLNVNTLTATQGVEFLGPSSNGKLGSRISSAGDNNNDGINDLIVSGTSVSVFSGTNAGAGYVFYGDMSLGSGGAMTATATITPSASISESISQTVTETPSASISESISQTVTATPSASISESISQIVTETSSASISESISQTVTATPSASISESISQTITITPSVSISESISQTVTATPSLSTTQSPSPSMNGNASHTSTTTPSLSESESVLRTATTSTPSLSTTQSPSTSVNKSASHTSTMTPSLSESESFLRTATTTPPPSTKESPSTSVEESTSHTSTTTPSPTSRKSSEIDVTRLDTSSDSSFDTTFLSSDKLSTRLDTTSGSSKLEVPWFLSVRLVKSFISFWKSEDNSAISELVDKPVNIKQGIGNNEENTVITQDLEHTNKRYDKYKPSNIIEALANTSLVIKSIDYLTDKAKELTGDCPSYFPNIDSPDTYDWITNNIHHNAETGAQILTTVDMCVLGGNICYAQIDG